MVTTESVRGAVQRLATATELDRVAKPVATWVADAVGHGQLKDVLSGTWLGHPLHPMLTDVPIGSWTSAFVLDLVGGARGRRAADLLVGIGVVSALPTAAAGLADWSDTLGEERRIGAGHAIGNVTAVALYGMSWVARWRGRRGWGLTLGWMGAAAATAGAYLGGHLVYRKGVGADRNAWKDGPDDWVGVGDETDLHEGTPMVATAGDDDVLLVRRGNTISAISDVCGHAGGPLHEGTLDEQGCVTCPWHASTFRLADGHVVHGPATGHQPAYDVRSEGGRLSIRRRPPAS